VFYPTMEEFQDFSGYLERVEATIGYAGIFKVVAPPEWVPRKSGYTDVKKFPVKKPIEQNVSGSRGVYELVYFVKESKSLERFERTAKQYDSLVSGKSHEQIERLFWRSLKNNAPVYGADVSGSLFDEGVPWNLNEIKTILKDGLKN